MYKIPSTVVDLFNEVSALIFICKSDRSYFSYRKRYVAIIILLYSRLVSMADCIYWNAKADTGWHLFFIPQRNPVSSLFEGPRFVQHLWYHPWRYRWCFAGKSILLYWSVMGPCLKYVLFFFSLLWLSAFSMCFFIIMNRMSQEARFCVCIGKPIEGQSDSMVQSSERRASFTYNYHHLEEKHIQIFNKPKINLFWIVNKWLVIIAIKYFTSATGIGYWEAERVV